MDRAINRSYEEYTPVVEWSHSPDASFAKIIVPGFKREEIRVLVDNHGHLRTRGERPLQGNKWSRFQKDLQLPSDCNVDGICAKFENEALTITLPKKHPSPQAAPVPPAMPAPAPMTPKPEPRRPSTAPPLMPPPALPEPAKPTTVLPPVPSQKSFPDRRPSLPRKPSDVPAPARPAPPVPAPAPAPELESLKNKKYNEAAATAKPAEDGWLKDEAKKAQAAAAAEEEERRMEREARGKMEEDRKMAEEMKKPTEADGIMDMQQRRRPTTASRGLLVNVAVAVVVLVGITVYVWHNLSAAVGGDGNGDVGAGSYGDEM